MGPAGSSERALVDAAWRQFAKIAGGDRSNRIESDGLPAIPGYRILGEVHRGGQGVVYQAIQESTRRKVAVKVLKHGPFADATEFARFDREIDLLSRLNHPHIVAVRDRGVTSGHAYYVMDYVPGQSLDAFVAGADLSLHDLLRLFVAICDAVNVAHLRGVIHRDLKPGNIRVDEQGNPRILDFGLAKHEQQAVEASSAKGMTMTGQFVGSLPWASPEQAEGRTEALDIRTDVYSLGVILYQLLTSRFPYPVTGRANEVIRHIAETNPARPTAVRPAIDHEVELIVLKCLAKEPDRRYQSAGELARDIRHYLADEPILATPATARYRIRKFVQRNRALVFTGLSIAAILVVATVVSILFGLSAARQRNTAQGLLARAEKAEKESTQRADQLERTVKFQATQLGEIDARSMGVQLRADLLRKARAAAGRTESSPEARDAGINELERLIAGTDFTGLALGSLDESVFKPTLVAIDKDFADQPLVKARLLQAMANTLRKLGLLESARRPQEQALAIRREILGVDNPDTLNSLNDMGVLLRHTGKLAEAEQHHREALEKGRRVRGSDHPDTLEALSSLGAVLMARSNPAEAETCYREVLESRRRVLGEEHHDTLVAISQMGTLLQAQGKPAEAEKYIREALEKCRRVLGEDAPSTVTTLNNLGHLLWTQDRLEEAETCFRESLERTRRVRGDEHPITLISINNMGSLLRVQGELTESEALHREALDKQRRLLGDTHPHTLVSMNNMGMVLCAQERFAEAEPYYREVLEKRRRLLGNDHSDTLNSIHNLSVLLKLLDKPAEAEPLYRELLEARRRLLGNEHPSTLASVTKLGDLLWTLDKGAEAEALYRESLEASRRKLGDEHPDTLMAIGTLADLYESLGRQAESVALLAGSEASIRRAFTETEPVQVGRWLLVLGRARIATGAFDAAAKNLNEAHAFLVAATPDEVTRDRTDVLNAQISLYDAWHAAEPDRGYDIKASEWRSKRDSRSALPRSTPDK